MENEFRELLNQNWSETFKAGGASTEFAVQHQRPSVATAAAGTATASAAQQLNSHEAYQAPCQPPTPAYPSESEQFINSVLSKVSNSISSYMSKVNNFVTTANGGSAASSGEYTPSQEYLQKFNIYSGLVQQQQQQQQRNQEFIQDSAYSSLASSAACPNLIGIKDLKAKAVPSQRQPIDTMISLVAKSAPNQCTAYAPSHQARFDGPTASSSSTPPSSSSPLCKSALLIGNGSSGGSIVDATASCQTEKKSNAIIDSTTPPPAQPPQSLPATMHCTSSSAIASTPRPNSINFARAVSTGELDKKMANSIRGTAHICPARNLCIVFFACGFSPRRRYSDRFETPTSSHLCCRNAAIGFNESAAHKLINRNRLLVRRCCCFAKFTHFSTTNANESNRRQNKI